MKRKWTQREEIVFIREWFERHRSDYCQCESAPPKAWAENMAFLLMALGEPPTADAVDPHADVLESDPRA